MAKILVSAACPIFDDNQFKFTVFHEGFLKSLAECGNESKVFNTASFLARPWNGTNQSSFLISDEKIAATAKEFGPDLIIAFNHSIPRAILDATTCPVAVWNADSFAYFNDPEYIKDNMDRYKFLCFSHGGVSDAKKFGASENQVHFLVSGTAVKAEPLVQDKNISFIGTNFIAPETFLQLLRLEKPQEIKVIADLIAQDYHADHHALLNERGFSWVEDLIDLHDLSVLSATQSRISLLNDLQEYGLTIYGDSDWYSVGRYLPWLAMSYCPDKAYSLQHNQDIYNASKICINISHSQAADGFPWRVMDIMASNGCLVSDRRQGIADFTKGYVDIPMYDSRQEAVELCRKLLVDDVWRREIVAGSQKCIEEKGRWEGCLREMGSFLAIDLLGSRANPTECSLDKMIVKASTHRVPYARLVDVIIGLLIKAIPNRLQEVVYIMALNFKIRVPYHFVAYTKKLRHGRGHV